MTQATKTQATKTSTTSTTTPTVVATPKSSFAEVKRLAESQGFLTYEQAHEFLPDEIDNADAVSRLLDMVDSLGIDFVEGDHTPQHPEVLEAAEASDGERLFTEDLPKLTDDPIRMYLSQMCRIPLLTRDEEICSGRSLPCKRRSKRSTRSMPANCRLIGRSRSH